MPDTSRDYPCTSCGLCCKQLGKVLQYGSPNPKIQALIDTFPYKPNEDGVCPQLNSDNQCSVYETRPILCNIALIADILGESTDSYYNKSISACNQLIKQYNLDKSYLIGETW